MVYTPHPASLRWWS